MYKLFAIFILLGCAARPVASQTGEGSGMTVAFPGAEGFGKYTTGGRGGKVLIVSNLNDDGKGSFREAVQAKFKRIIVFSVAGTIHLESPLMIRGDVTIAGQSAPGEGICVADHPVMIAGDNVIIRYMRFRMGDRFQGIKGKVDGSGADDALSASRRRNIIVDHCSISWSTDEVFSVYGGDSTTLQWNLVAEPLNYSFHFEKGDTDWERHGYGGIWGGAHTTAHHNLFMNCLSRNPRFNGTRLNALSDFVDFRNNVVYNWGTNSVYGGEGGTYNMVGNYFKPGPSTAKKVAARIVNPSRNNDVGFGRFYVQGNVMESSPEVTANNLLGIQFDNKTESEGMDTIVMKYPFAAIPIPAEDAGKAFAAVLLKAGASAARDTLDIRLVEDIKLNRGRIIDVQGGFAHGTPYDVSKIAWPVLKGGQPQPDADNDGMPDAWEVKHGLNKQDSTDAAGYNLSRVFTNIEVYLNGLVFP